MKSTLNIAIACLTLAGTLSCSETGSLPDSSGPTAGNAGTTIFQIRHHRDRTRTGCVYTVR